MPKKPKNHEVILGWSQQSPIDLGKSFQTPDLPALTINYPASLTGKFDPNDHNLHIIGPHTAAIIYDGITCPLVKLHFHAPSEHSVNGVEAAFEAHLIHKVPVFPEAYPSAFIVLGVLYDNPPKNPKAKVAKYASLEQAVVRQFIKGKVSEEVQFDPNVFLPSEKEHHYRYEGSLTTEPFSEFVSWIVFREHGILDSEFEIKTQGHTHEEARHLQPLNRRFVLRNFA